MRNIPLKTEWIVDYINHAEFVAQKSKDSTKVGAVIVSKNNSIISTGYNGFPRNVFDNPINFKERHQRPTKYFYTEHAERNAIYNAARNGVALSESAIFLNYSPNFVCCDCMRAIIQSGIKYVCGPARELNNKNKWKEHIEHTINMAAESDIQFEIIPDTMFNPITISLSK